MNVDLLNHMGSDESIVDAARVSFSKDASKYTLEQNIALIKYLASGLRNQEKEELLNKIISSEEENAEEVFNTLTSMHKHWSPFAHAFLSFRVSAPLNIKVQCFKHKIGLSENEESRRYIKTKPNVFVPMFRQAAEDVKQGSGDIHPDLINLQFAYNSSVQYALNTYQYFIDNGVAPEQARMVLPQGMITTWIWSGSLYAFANFYNQRTDSHAQKEIQDLAHLIGEYIEPLFPISWNALTCKKKLKN